jgi:hypothetical protein
MRPMAPLTGLMVRPQASYSKDRNRAASIHMGMARQLTEPNPKCIRNEHFFFLLHTMNMMRLKLFLMKS